MDFGANKTPVKVIKEDAFGGTYFRDVFCSVNNKWYRKSQKEFDELNTVDRGCCCLNYYDVNVNKYGIKCETSLRFWEIKGWINYIDPYGQIQWYFRYWLGRSLDDERQINRWKVLVSRIKGKVIKMIKYVIGRFDDYSI